MSTQNRKMQLDNTVEIISGGSEIFGSVADTRATQKIATTESGSLEISERDSLFAEFKNLVGSRWDGNRNVVKTYIAGLEKRNDAKSRFLLAKALKSGASPTQKMVCEALARMGGDAIDILVQNLTGADGRLHAEAFRALRLDGKHNLPRLLDLLSGRVELKVNEASRQILLRLIGEIPSKRVSGVLCEYLASTEKGLREMALQGLRRQGLSAEIAVLEGLQKLSARPGSAAERSAMRDFVFLLGLMRSRRALPLLLPKVHEQKDGQILSILVWALGEIRDPVIADSLSYLLGAGGHPWFIKKTIIQALGKIGCVDSFSVVEPYLADVDLREAAIEALGRIGGDESVQALVPFLDSPIRYLRCLTISALAAIRTRESIRYVLSGLADPEVLVRRHTEKTLRKIYSADEMERILSYVSYQVEAEESARADAWDSLTADAADSDESAELVGEDTMREVYPERDSDSSADPYASDAWNGFGNPAVPPGPAQRVMSWFSRLRRRAFAEFDRLAPRGPGGSAAYDPWNQPFPRFPVDRGADPRQSEPFDRQEQNF